MVAIVKLVQDRQVQVLSVVASLAGGSAVVGACDRDYVIRNRGSPEAAEVVVHQGEIPRFSRGQKPRNLKNRI